MAQEKKAQAATIFVVDDDDGMRRALDTLLSTVGYKTAVYSRPTEFLANFKADAPGCLVLDIRMPDMSGLDAINAIRGEFPDARIVVLTTYSGDVQALRAIQAGARAYLLKNEVHKQLLDTIRVVFAGKKTMSPHLSFELAEHAGDDALTKA